MVIIYNIILSFLLLLLFPVILQRYKFDNIDKQYDFWVHCASLGEVKIALKLIDVMSKKLNLTKNKFLLTTTTFTAKKFAKKFHEHTYIFPLDYWFVTRKYVKKIKPKLFIILETELWPNCIYFVKQFNSKIFIVNGRMTGKTFVFLNVFKWLLLPVLNKIDYILVREKIDYTRFANLGFSKEKIKITGNMKYDEIDSNSNLAVSKSTFGFSEEDFIITFGSIREGEEKEIIKVVYNFVDNDSIKFILAPRHINTVSKIIRILQKYSVSYALWSMRRNILNGYYKCVIVDTYGELNKFYAVSDIVFVCGSILPYGGQNILEPASLGKLVVFGKYITNFMEPARLLLSNNAAIQVNVIEEFINIIIEFYKHRENLAEYGNRAKEVLQKLKGVTERNIDIITAYLYENFNN